VILTRIAGITPSGNFRPPGVPSVRPGTALILNTTLIFRDKRSHFLPDLSRASYIPSIGTRLTVSCGLAIISWGQFSLHARPTMAAT
jgi:hypothetical protein